MKKILWFIVTLIVYNFDNPVKSSANPYDRVFIPDRFVRGHDDITNRDSSLESDQDDPRDECYRTECNTDTFRIMKALSVRKEALVYCKNNQRCDCCIRSDLTEYEEDLLLQQIIQENRRLGIEILESFD